MVRNIAAVTLIFLCISHGLFGKQNAGALFKKAHQLYEVGSVEGALALYKKIEPKGPGTWFNMSACYYALQNYPLAIVCAKRAQKGASSSLLETIDRILPALYSQVSQRYDSLDHRLGYESWAVSYSPLLIQLLFLISWYVCWFFLLRRRTMTFFPFLYGIFLCLSILFGALLLMHYYTHVYKKGMTVKEARLLVGPHDQYDLLQEIPPLREIEIKERFDEWYKITVDGKMGWVRAQTVETL